MPVDDQPFVVLFPDWYDDLAEFEHSHKGYLGGVVVALTTGEKYSLYFSDLARLRQELEDNLAIGVACFVEKNMVIVTRVTKTNIMAAINAIGDPVLWRRTFLPED